MARGYQGFQGYGAADGEAIARQQRIAEAMMQNQMQNRGPVQHWTQGLARLADAYIARNTMNKANTAQSEYSAGRAKMADALMGQMFPDAGGVTRQDLSANAPFDLSPQAAQGRSQQGALGDQARAMANYTGDPMQAIQFALMQQDRAKADQRYEQERTDNLRKPVMASPGQRAYLPSEDGKWEEIFNVPETPGTSPGGRVQSVQVDETGRARAIMADATVRDLGFNTQNPYTIQDVGGVPTAINRRDATGRPVATAQEVGQNKAVIGDITQRGEAQTQAALSLPDAIRKAQAATKLIDDMVAHEGFASRYGMGSVGGLMPALPGGKGAGAQAYIDQLKGVAFLQAFESLKGGGQITQIEGNKATAAITRLQDQRIGPEEAKIAAEEFKQATNNLIILNRAKAGMLTPQDLANLTDEQLEMIASDQ